MYLAILVEYLDLFILVRKISLPNYHLRKWYYTTIMCLWECPTVEKAFVEVGLTFCLLSCAQRDTTIIVTSSVVQKLIKSILLLMKCGSYNYRLSTLSGKQLTSAAKLIFVHLLPITVPYISNMMYVSYLNLMLFLRRIAFDEPLIINTWIEIFKMSNI